MIPAFLTSALPSLADLVLRRSVEVTTQCGRWRSATDTSSSYYTSATGNSEIIMKAIDYTAAMFTLALTGCIPYPTVPEELPFKDEEIAFIEPGVTTRQEVQQELKWPLSTQGSDRIAIYAEARTVGGWLLGSETEPIESFHYLIVTYGADDIVQSFDVIRGKKGCGSDGVCIKNLGFEPWHVVVFARPKEDETAKSFPVYAEQCSIYLYETGDRAMLRINWSGGSTNVNEDGYLHWIAEPGPATITATGLMRFSAMLGAETDLVSASLDLDCEPRRIYFLRAAYDGKWFGDDKLTLSIDQMETGKKLVGERRLMIH